MGITHPPNRRSDCESPPRLEVHRIDRASGADRTSSSRMRGDSYSAPPLHLDCVGVERRIATTLYRLFSCKRGLRNLRVAACRFPTWVKSSVSGRPEKT